MASPNGLTPNTDDFDIEDAFTAPETKLDSSDQKRVGRLSKTKAWKELLEHIDTRESLYRSYLPGGNPAIISTHKDADWVIADCVIREFELLKTIVDTFASN